MAEHLVIQLVTEKIDEEGEIQRQFRWGITDELSDWTVESHLGSAEDLIDALKSTQRPAVLLLPGHHVVTAIVPYNKKEAKHFLKLLPYEIEDDVLSNVDDLHFAVGGKGAEQATIAYVDSDWFMTLMAWFKQYDVIIERCIADFQCLQAVGEELTLWFTDGYLWGHRANGSGFSVAQHLSQALLKDLLVNQQDAEFPWTVKVYVPDTETKEIVESHIVPPVEYSVTVGQPSFDFAQANQLNFSTGSFSKQLPINEWWQEARAIVYLAAAAFVVFLGVAFADIYSLQQARENNQLATVDAFRTVVPRGPTEGAVRRLQARLGSGGVENNTPSNSVFLLSKIAPILSGLNIDLATLNYSYREKSLRVSVKAESFSGIEQFRQQLAAEGVSAELQSSNAIDEGFQARLLIQLADQG